MIKSEFLCFVSKILDEIDEHGIKIYHLPDAESDEDEDFKEQTRILKVNQRSFSSLQDLFYHQTALINGSLFPQESPLWFLLSLTFLHVRG